MLQVEEALAAVLSAAASARAAPRGVPLHDALGLVLAEEVRAPDPLPPFRASIKVGRPFRPLLFYLLSAAPWRPWLMLDEDRTPPAGRVRRRVLRRARGVPGDYGVEGRQRRARRGRRTGHGRLRHHRR